jgi:hypothetical protein
MRSGLSKRVRFEFYQKSPYASLPLGAFGLGAAGYAIEAPALVTS